MLEFYLDPEELEAGIDEVGRGCLAGPVYAAAVIWPKFLRDDRCEMIKDSKKLSAKKREMLAEFIKENALSYSIGIVNETDIDHINILQSSYKAMHRALDGLDMIPESVIVDGDYFKTYIDKDGDFVTHTCIKNGDNKYMSIACASIIAKVARDKFITDLCIQYPILNRYDWKNNKCYGTKKHRDAIKKYGLSPFHRKTFGTCKKYKVSKDYIDVVIDI